MKASREYPFEPGREPPPIKDRPNCAGCGERMTPDVRGGSETKLHGVERRYWTGEYKGYNGLFCTLRCALRFATNAFNAGAYKGYRRRP